MEVYVAARTRGMSLMLSTAEEANWYEFLGKLDKHVTSPVSSSAALRAAMHMLMHADTVDVLKCLRETAKAKPYGK